MIKKIAIVVSVLLGIVLALAMMQPNSFRVTRSIAIKAPPEKLMGMISDFHQWSSWSPWEKLDPGMQRSFSGAASGKGAVYGWVGNDKVGQGRMEVLELNAPNKIVIKLDFIEPIAANDMSEFILDTKGDMTTVSWHMYGPSDFMTKVMGVFVSMDSMVGKDFERGLANMKEVAEAR
jgi:uncharacterized protein YndB with AHSA1/START domain